MSARLWIAVLVTIAWPLLVFAGLLSHVQPRWMALGLAVLGIWRAWAARDRFWTGVAGLALVLAAAAVIFNHALPLKLYPVAVNAGLLLVFCASLLHPPSAIERIARRMDPQPPDAAIPYTRRVTQVWAGFFAVNGMIAFITAAWGSDFAWTLYNGVLSYVAMGVLFAIEWGVRRRVMRRAAQEQVGHD